MSAFRLDSLQFVAIHDSPFTIHGLSRLSALRSLLKNMEESYFKALRELERDSTLSQRELSKKVGLSVGRINFIINALLQKGYIKAQRFKNSKNKSGYMYILTPKGLSEKIVQTQMFLYRKTVEYEKLKAEIEKLREEADIIKKQ